MYIYSYVPMVELQLSVYLYMYLCISYNPAPWWSWLFNYLSIYLCTMLYLSIFILHISYNPTPWWSCLFNYLSIRVSLSIYVLYIYVYVQCTYIYLSPIILPHDGADKVWEARVLGVHGAGHQDGHAPGHDQQQVGGEGVLAVRHIPAQCTQ